MLFPKANIDTIIQIGDKFRIDATGSFFTENEDLTAINIYPDFTLNPTKVFNVLNEGDNDCWFLDYAFSLEGGHTVKLEMVTASDTASLEYTITALSTEDDALFSKDADLYAYESELSRYIPEGRNSWNHLHRKAQEKIIDYLYRNNITTEDGLKITKDQILDDSFNQWSIFETLILIYQEIKISNSELFTQKLNDYAEERNEARERYKFIYDTNKDGILNKEDRQTATRPDHFTR